MTSFAYHLDRNSCFPKFSRFVFLLFCSASKTRTKFALQSGLFCRSPSARGDTIRAEILLGRHVSKNSYRSNVVAPLGYARDKPARPSVSPPLFLRALGPAVAGYCSCPNPPGANNLFVKIRGIPFGTNLVVEYRHGNTGDRYIWQIFIWA